MTDKINDKKLESMKGEPLNPQDEELFDLSCRCSFPIARCQRFLMTDSPTG